MARDIRLHTDGGTPVDARDVVLVGVLGPLTVAADGREVHIAGSRRRCLLALLASRAGRMVPVEAIVDALWGDEPPTTATKTIQSHIVRLRRSLGAVGRELIETVPGGYRLVVEAGSVDAVRFENLLADGARELARGADGRARDLLSEALTLWRGPAYAEFAGAEFAAAEAVRLAELRLRAIEDLAEAHLAGETVAAAVPELEHLVSEQPGRERAWALLMRSLYASGRQHDALVAYQRARRALAESFGLEPGPELRALERRILDQDPELVVAGDRPALPAALRATQPLIGRRAELAWLTEAWQTARHGTGQVRVVLGPVDGGRTRLAAELAAHVIADGGWVEYVRGGGQLADLVRAGAPTAGAVVDAVADRCRRGPLLIVVDDVEWMPAAGVPAVEAVAAAAERLSLLVLVIADADAGGLAVGALRRLPAASATSLGPMPDHDLARLVAADGVDVEGVTATVAVSHGLPGVARREAAAWAERAAGDRLQAAAASSLGAAAAAQEARSSVFDDVLALVAARSRRDELVNPALAGRQPYRALAAYGPEDADLFVGRERLVAELAARVLDRRMVAVVGASGSGKSSLVRAGLLPLVRSGRLSGEQPWRASVIVPGNDALVALEGVAELDEPGTQLLIVDQFEEAMTNRSGEALASRLVDLVLDAALDIHVVIVVRADQYGALTSIRPLAEMVEDAQVLVGPPTDDELRRIVEVPARRTGCDAERTLVDLVIDEVAAHDAALPLVSAALADVWERRDGDTLTAARYVEIGGLAAAVERLGERAVQQASDADGIRHVMMRLVDITDEGHWVRRRVPVEDVPDELAPALDCLVDARLVRRDDRTVDVVHEVVFTAWPRLVAWLEEARSDLVLDRELRAAARAWDAEGRADDDVYRGARLAAAVEFAARHPGVGEHVKEFVAAGERVADRRHRLVREQLARESRARRHLTRALGSVAVLLVAAIAAGAFAIVNERRADRQRERATTAAEIADDERARAQTARLVAESERELGSHLDLALLLAVEARRHAGTPETDGALLTALTHNTPAEADLDRPPTNTALVGFLAGPPRLQYDVDISNDGRIVASGGNTETGEDGLALVFDTESRQLVGRIASAAPIERVDVSDDGAAVLAVDSGGAAHLFETSSGTVTAVASDGPLARALFRPGGEQFVTTSSQAITVWDRATMTALHAAIPPAPRGSAEIAPDGTLAIVERTLRTRFHDLDTGSLVREVQLQAPDVVLDRFVSTHGDLLVAVEATSEGRVWVWDLGTGEPLGEHALPRSGVRAMAINPAQPWLLAVGSSGGGVSMHDLERERALGEPLTGHGSGVRDVTFSADGRYLATVADDGSIGLWGATGTGPVAPLTDSRASDPAYSADGRRVAVRIPDGVEVRDAERPAEPGVAVTAPDGSQLVRDPLQLSDDGSTVLAFTADIRGVPFVADASTGIPVWVTSDEDFHPAHAALSPDGRIVAAVDVDNERLRAWEVRTGERVGDTSLAELAPDRPLGVSGQPVFSPDGQHVDVATNLGVARFGGSDLRPVAFAAAGSAVQGAVDHVPGTSHVIVGGVGGQIVRLDMSTGEHVARGRSRDSSSLLNIAVSPDASMIAAYHPFSHRIALFDAATLRPVGRPFPVGTLWFTPQFMPDGRTLAGNGLFNELTHWGVDPASWQASACRAAGRNLTGAEWAQYLPDEPYRPTCAEWPATP